VDDGRFHIGHASLAIDTRNNEDDPWSGWYITADYELGSGTVTTFGPSTLLARPAPADQDVTYHRGFLDLRRYNRISPDAQLNLRVVLGGWLAGDELPLQRRLSVGGSGTLPGFDFRRFYESEDVGMCTTAGDALQGRPAMCERVALFQAEYRGDLLFGRDWDAADRWLGGLRRSDMAWVLFFDAGRGWLVGDQVGEIQYESGSLPSFGTFRTDIGLGIDLGLLGIYVAKSISQSKEPANVFVRIRHRF
jgi:outer membrane protein assembly factor BamA